jgi:hypothetical protein
MRVNTKDIQVKEHLKNKPEFANFIWNGSNITAQLKCDNLLTLTQQLSKLPNDPLLNICLGSLCSEQGYSLQQLSYDEQQKSTISGKIFRTR